MHISESSQRCPMSSMGSKITGKSTSAQQAQNKVNIKTPHYWRLVRGIHWWVVDSPHRGSVTRIAFLGHGFIMLYLGQNLEWNKIWYTYYLRSSCTLLVGDPAIQTLYHIDKIPWVTWHCHCISLTPKNRIWKRKTPSLKLRQCHDIYTCFCALFCSTLLGPLFI